MEPQEVTPDQKSIVGMLLVATPILLDPNFHRTVLFIEEHNEEGALGIVLNRPTEADIAEHLPEWELLVTGPRVVFVGGPVANEIAIGLVRDPAVLPEGWSPNLLGVGLVDLGLGPESVVEAADVRVFSGYAGWVGGQLEMELATGSWLVVRPLISDLFTDEPEALWRTVLRRQVGNASVYSSFPDDPRAN